MSEPGRPISDHDHDAAACTLARLRTVLGLATLAMLALSWPLWITTDAFPRVPFAPGIPDLSTPVSWGLYTLLMLAVAAAAAGLAWRTALSVGLSALVFLILQDQHRFQPWAYQFLIGGLLLVSLSPERALRYARWWLAALYFHSGLSKLDVSFCREMGRLFLTTAVRPFGLDPATWPPAWQDAAILAMPAAEIAIAVALVLPRTRRIGLGGAWALHTALLGILGPWGLRHSTIVLVWNVAMMIEAAILCWPESTGREAATTGEPARRAPVVGVLTIPLFWLGVLAPLGERSGFLDAWPAHALYASHVERTGVFFHEQDSDQWPPDLRRYLGAENATPWRRFDLTGWSREVRGVPVYPQGRACNGLAEFLAARYRSRLLIQVIQWGRADRWTGQRTWVECVGLEAIRRQGNRYWLNAHPAGGFAHAPAASDARPVPVP